MRAWRVTVAAGHEDLATAALWEAGTAGVEVRGGPEGQVDLLAYFADDAPPLTLALLPPGAAVERAAVPEVDWVARFRAGFRAFRVGRFVVAPPWDAPDRPSPDVLVVDPGRAFGTGTHETTRLCLGALEDLAARRPLGRTLDLGSGTGSARHRGRAPGRLSRLRLRHRPGGHQLLPPPRAHQRRPAAGRPRRRGRGLRAGSFDLVLANLMALLLVDRSAEIRSLLAPGGALVLSGLLADDLPFVREAFAACGTPAERLDGEWGALVYEGAR